jgi:hypothetical protein
MAETQEDQKKGPVMTWADDYMRQNYPEMLANAVTPARAAVGLDTVCRDPSRAAFPLDKVINHP